MNVAYITVHLFYNQFSPSTTVITEQKFEANKLWCQIDTKEFKSFICSTQSNANDTIWSNEGSQEQ